MPVDEAVLEAPEVSADTGADEGEGFEGESESIDDGLAEGESEAVEGDGEQTEEEGEAEGEQEQVAADGRKMPDSLKKAIAGIKTTNPEAAKEIKGLFFANREYQAVFPKPADAMAAKDLIEQVGGTEGIQNIQAERDEWGGLDAKYGEGSPDFAKTIADNNPEAFLKNAPHVINEFAQRAPEQYAYYANTVALNTLANIGITPESLAGAYGQLDGNPQAQALVANIHNALMDVKGKTAAFEQKRTDPREAAIAQRETAFEQQRRAAFEGGVASQAETYLAEKMQPEIDRILAGRKADPEALDTMKGLVNAEIQKRLADVPGFKNQLEAFYRNGDAQKSLDYVKSQYNRILPEAVKKAIGPLYRNIKPAAVPAKQANGQPARTASAGEVTLREMPDWNDLDPSWRNRPEATAELMQGRAVLKNGKKATGWA